MSGCASWGYKPQREDWKVHSLSAGQEPLSLLVTFTSSTAMLPSVPPTSASIINWEVLQNQNQSYFILPSIFAYTRPESD